MEREAKDHKHNAEDDVHGANEAYIFSFQRCSMTKLRLGTFLCLFLYPC